MNKADEALMRSMSDTITGPFEDCLGAEAD